jgi:hypothetical protein
MWPDSRVPSTTSGPQGMCLRGSHRWNNRSGSAADIALVWRASRATPRNHRRSDDRGDAHAVPRRPGPVSLSRLERTVVTIEFWSLPLLGAIVGTAIGSLGTPLRGAFGGAMIGGLNTLIGWSLGWWFSNRANSTSVPAMLIYNSIMLYLPSAVIASAMVGAVASVIHRSLAAAVRLKKST